MAEESRKQFAVEELSFLFAALERIGSPCVLIGGQAACYWARLFLQAEPALAEMQDVDPFLSKDVDWSQMLPHNFIGASTQPELVRLREFRIPLWLAQISTHKRAIPEGKTLLGLLEILARHAEPLCAQPATSNRQSPITNPKSK